jgi:hypothetical protein
MLPGQLQFDFLEPVTTAPSTAAVTGTRLRLPSPCHCGSDIVTIGSSKGPHNAAIHCSGCGVHRGWISRAEFDRIVAIIGKSGRPAQPIDIGSAR